LAAVQISTHLKEEACSVENLVLLAKPWVCMHPYRVYGYHQ